MNSQTYSLISAVLIGLGGTLTFDLWALFLKRIFKIPPSNICLVGRWLVYVPAGTFWHANIAATPPKRVECRVGWIVHYLIGATFAFGFVTLVGNGWLEHPTLVPALGFGVATVLAPFALMQPAFGLGFAAAKSVNPWQARLRSLLNHAAFSIGLYVFAWLVSGALW